VVQFEVPAIVPADPQANVTDLLVERVKATPNLALFSVPDGDGWRDVTAAEFQKQVIALAKGFAAAGLEPGDKVGFIARTTYNWTLVDFALFYAGAVMTLFTFLIPTAAGEGVRELMFVEMLGGRIPTAKAFLIGHVGFWIEKLLLSFQGGIFLIWAPKSYQRVTREDLERLKEETTRDRSASATAA